MSYTTSLGVTVEFLPLPPMLIDKIQAAHRPPSPPTYTVKTATGATETHVHDATTVQTDEEKAALAQYETECSRIEADLNRALTRLALLKGVKAEMPADEDWIKEQEFLGLVVPTEPTERRLHWIETCVIGTKTDLEAVLQGVGMASGAREEDLAQARETFRHSVGLADGDAARTPAGGEDGQGVVLQPAVRGGQDGGEERFDRHGVRRPRGRR